MLARPRKGEFTVRTEDIEAIDRETADELAVIVLAGVNFFTGQLLTSRKSRPWRKSTASSSGSISPTRSATCRWRCTIGTSISPFGVPTNISIPARARSPAHSERATRHQYKSAAARRLVRQRSEYAFPNDLEPEFIPGASADGWQVSNPPISRWRHCVPLSPSSMKPAE